jgi:hypothetical protein
MHAAAACRLGSCQLEMIASMLPLFVLDICCSAMMICLMQSMQDGARVVCIETASMYNMRCLCTD